MKLKILLSDVRAVSEQHYDALIHSGSIENGCLVLDYAIFLLLRRQFSAPVSSQLARRAGMSINGFSYLKPGDLFSIVILKITGAGPCPNQCRERIAQMNDWGWWKCWRNRKTIATWLAEEARRRGHQITDSSALDLFRAAFKELRQHRSGKPSAPPLQSL